MLWFCRPRRRTRQGEFDAHRDRDDHSHADTHFHPHPSGRNRYCHRYVYFYIHTDEYSDKYKYVNSIPHIDAFVYTNPLADSVVYSHVDAEFYQHTYKHSFEYSYADRDSYRYDHSILTLDARRSSISEILALRCGSFGWGSFRCRSHYREMVFACR